MNYKELPNDTRIWVYQANRQLTSEEVKDIKCRGEEFIGEWTAHGAKLKAVIEIFHNQFVVLFADENQANASGCSIDKSVHFIKEIEKHIGITLMDRDLITYKKDEIVMTCTRTEFSELMRNGVITSDTLVFDNLISVKAALEDKWLVPVHQSWHRELCS